jgi:putative transposase
MLSWYGVYWKEERLYSTICPVCEGKLMFVEKIRRARIMRCVNCGFKEDRDSTPLYWAIKSLPALKGEASTWGERCWKLI